MEKLSLQSVVSVLPLLPKLYKWLRRMWRSDDEAIVMDELASRNLLFCSSAKTSLFFIEKSVFLSLNSDAQRDLKQLRNLDFEAYSSQILQLMKQHKQRYDNTFLGHKVYVIMSSIKLARQLGIKNVHCMIADDDLYKTELSDSPDRKALSQQRERIKNEKKNEKYHHEYSSFNEMNKLVLNICKGDLRRKIPVDEEAE